MVVTEDSSLAPSQPSQKTWTSSLTLSFHQMVNGGARIKMGLLQVVLKLQLVKNTKLSHFNTTGLVGQLQFRRSDIGWANMFMIPDRMKYIDYTIPYTIDHASFMLSKFSYNTILGTRYVYYSKLFPEKPPVPPQWMRIFTPLQKSTWLGTQKYLTW